MALYLHKFLKGSWLMNSKKQVKVGLQLQEKFPHSTSLGCVNHLLEEVKELKQAIKKRTNIEEELADCELILTHIAHKEKVVLEKAAEDKLRIVLKREYGKINRKGYCKHIKNG